MSLKKHIPNAVTTLNLVCGILGVVSAFDGRIELAFVLMLAASVFDFCDGLCARLLKAYSPIGKELDSLCDMVSFALLPSVLLYSNMMVFAREASTFLCLVPFLLCIGGALRLAKFNVDERQREGFLGLATPVSALLCASMCSFVEVDPNSFLGAMCTYSWFIPALSIVLFVLTISEIPMFSLKFGKKSEHKLLIERIMFLIDCLVILLGVIIIRKDLSLAVFLSATLYIIKNLIGFLVFKLSKSHI